MATFEAGNRPLRVEWIEETTEGETPADPEWELFSDNIVSVGDWEPDANTTRLDAAGEITAQGFFNGVESHDFSVSYSLQRWYVDGNGDPVDAGGYFLEPASDNSLQATHSILMRTEQADGGADSAGRRIYVVVKGAHPDSLTAPFEVEEGTPIEQALDYQAEKIREYQISQPSASTKLDVENTGSTSVDVTIESEDAATTETITVSGGSTATTTATFSDIDAVELSTDIGGDIIVTDGSGTTFTTIDGGDNYPTGEGDLGVPALGSGSHAAALGSDFVRFLDDTLDVPNVESDVEFISGEMSVETGLDDNAVLGSARRNIHAAEWNYTVTATLAGSRVSVDQTQNYLQEQTGTITWTAGEGSIDFNNAYLQSSGTVTRELGEGKADYDAEYEAETVTVSN